MTDSDPPPAPTNPYEPPRASDESASVATDRTQALKWAFLALAILAVALGTRGGHALYFDIDAGGTRSLGLAGLGAYVAGFLLRQVWLYLSWASLAPKDQKTASGRRISPGQAVGYSFIPCVGLFWMFIANTGFCEAINAVLRRSGERALAPRGLAVAACLVELAGGLCAQAIPSLLFVAPFFWFVFMVQTDVAKAAMQSAVEMEVASDPPVARPTAPLGDESYDARLDAELEALDK